MLTVIQRVQSAQVAVEETIIGQINQGLLILCGFSPEDGPKTLQNMLDKCLNYRLFADEQGKMNLSLQTIQGGLLLVPQFTLLADTKRGLRPSFSKAASPEAGQQLFNDLVHLAQEQHPFVASGRFGADMQVHLCNDGPVTFVMTF